MSNYLDSINPWPLGTPLPANTLYLVSVDKQEYRIEQSQLPSGTAGGSNYVNVTRAALLTLVQEEELVPGRLYVVSGRTTGRPVVAVQAVSGSQFSGVANQLEANGSVTVGTYVLATDTFTTGGLGPGAGGGATPSFLVPNADGGDDGILLEDAGAQRVVLAVGTTFATDLHVWEPGYPAAHRRSLAGLCTFSVAAHAIDISAGATTLANARLYGTKFTGAAVVEPPAPTEGISNFTAQGDDSLSAFTVTPA